VDLILMLMALLALENPHKVTEFGWSGVLNGHLVKRVLLSLYWN